MDVLASHLYALGIVPKDYAITEIDVPIKLNKDGHIDLNITTERGK